MAMDTRKRTHIVAVALALAALAWVILPPVPSGAQGDEGLRHGLVNLAHLQFLTEPVTFGEQDVAIVHIYSEYPEYAWVDAAGEGITAVDDVARAAIVYLWFYEQTGDQQALELARLCLDFVLYMQTEDGQFYNFVYDAAGTINTEGNTSYKTLQGWWAMRGLWSLAEGVRVFGPVDAAYAAELEAAYLRTETALAANLSEYGVSSQLHGYTIPAWIPGGAPDVASVELLALTSYYRANPNPATAALIEHIADGIAAYRLGDSKTYPFGMIPVTTNAPGYWHAWGSHMIHALAEAGALLDRQDWIDSAAASADTFLVRQLAFERIREIGILPRRLGQIAYGTNMLVQDYMALYRATGDERYAQFAGLAASWFFGNNMAGVTMYDPDSGHCFDGIEGPYAWRVNRNAGAESTLEALLALLAVHQDPVAARYLDYQEIAVRPYVRAEIEFGEIVAGSPDFRERDWTGESYFSFGQFYSLGAGDEMRVTFEVPETLDYWLYTAVQRMGEATEQTILAALRTSQSPTIDGELSEWANVPTFSVNTSRQFLRGVGMWRGPDVDSFDIQFMWDDDTLYLAARVRDPVHDQPETGPSVWGHDTLWVYVDGTGQGQRLSSKFTLAATPRGPQVWDWVASSWLPNAELAWQPFPAGDGYVYEAALPWRSLRVRNVGSGQVLGIEAGRGIGGDSFMDLTGADPDTAANLADLILINEVSDLDALGGADVVLSSAESAIALGVALDGGDTLVVPANTAPDRRYLWLDMVGPGPVHLEAGEHTLDVTYAGTDPKRRVAVDGFLIQPVVAQRTFAAPDGAQLTLTYDTLTGDIRIEEH